MPGLSSLGWGEGFVWEILGKMRWYRLCEGGGQKSFCLTQLRFGRHAGLYGVSLVEKCLCCFLEIWVVGLPWH